MRPSILIVDDDETIRETLTDCFAALDLPVRVAATATEGRRSIAATRRTWRWWISGFPMPMA